MEEAEFMRAPKGVREALTKVVELINYGDGRAFMSDLAEVVGSAIIGFTDDDELQAIGWGDFMLELAQFLGSAWGYGHVGPEARDLARYGCLGEAPDWPETFDGGVPPIWDTIHDAFTRKFGVAQ